MKDKFNKYCAEVMGYRTWKELDHICIENEEYPVSSGQQFTTYSPYDDLNQMAEVFDKLFKDRNATTTLEFLKISGMRGVKEAIQDFIISTMPEDKDK